jgi:hypothetical protein
MSAAQADLFTPAETPEAPPSIRPAFDLYHHPCEICGAYAPFGFGWPFAARWFCAWHLSEAHREGGTNHADFAGHG